MNTRNTPFLFVEETEAKESQPSGYPDIVKQHVVRLEEAICQVGRSSAGLADVLKAIDELEINGEKKLDLADVKCSFQLVRLAILFCEKEVRHLEEKVSTEWMCRSDYNS
ncbi:MAG: hypothetical protein PHV34_09275 [Verrucomicrobiae bacterium]|nr:hypothetical protein [Verrucomicrobiae bacterium]